MYNWKAICRKLKDDGALDLYAWHFACRVERMFSGPMDERLFLIAALVAHHAVCSKHICLDDTQVGHLSDILSVSNNTEEDLKLDEAFWSVLKDPSIAPALGDRASANKPLILEGTRLYLHRCYTDEVQLAQQLNDRVKTPCLSGPTATPADILTEAFKLDETQNKAIQATLKAHLSIITGGPGTGKTTILCVLLTELLLQNPRLRIHACAPTGKAQARMKEAIDSEFEKHIRQEVKQRLLESLEGPPLATLPVNYATVHRLLGYNPGTGNSTYSEENLLDTDVLVVDEVSMADLGMTVKLFSAIPKAAKIILLGDKDQLAAVEMGAVLGDIYAAWKDRPEVSHLKISHRFDAQSSIGKLTTRINAGDSAGVMTLLRDLEPLDEALKYEAVQASRVLPEMLKRVLEQNAEFKRFSQAADLKEAFGCFDSFRVLCPLRKGPWGVEQINAQMMQLLKIKPYQQGYPVMITVNDYAHQLFNGDVGLCFKRPGESEVRVWFQGAGDQYRSLGVAQLPEHEPVFAMTIHKAQGSGFDRVLMILPSEDSPILTRELLYTGITRTRKHCTLWGNADVITKCVSRATQRMSGLADRLEKVSKV